MSEVKSIPRWITIYGIIQVLLIIGFGSMFFMNSNPTIVNDPSWFVGVRNTAILIILLIGLFRQDVTILFCGYLLRFVVDVGDAVNSIIAGEFIYLAIFVPFLIVPLGYGAWTLWKSIESR